MRGSVLLDDDDLGDSGPDNVKDKGNNDDSPWEE